jgi:hypothetical protein
MNTLTEHISTGVPVEPMLLDRNGAPITPERHRQLRADPDYRHVARDQVGGMEVITVWLGTDQGPVGHDRWPLVFGSFIWDVQTRSIAAGRELFSATEDEALLSHSRLVDGLATKSPSMPAAV